MTAHLSRRQLLLRGAGLAAGVGLATVAGPARPAAAGNPTTGPVTWNVTGNGYAGDLRFWKRLTHERSWEVKSGFVADAYGDAALAYTWGFGGINVARLPARDLSYFQIWRTTGGTEVGPSGQFYDYTWNGSSYAVGGPYSWHTTLRVGGDDPWALPVDNEEKTSFDVISDSQFGHFPGWLRELHHYNDPSNERQLWGSVYNESFAGYTLVNAPLVSDWQSGGERQLRFEAPYNFLRALDPEFRAFQVYRGTYYRHEKYRMNEFGGWEFAGSAVQRAGSATHVDTVSGAQYPITWHTD